MSLNSDTVCLFIRTVYVDLAGHQILDIEIIGLRMSKSHINIVCFGTAKEYLSYLEMLCHYKSIHTNIIGHDNPTVRIIDLVSHTTYVVCVNFIHKWRDLQFKVDSKRQISWEAFHGNSIYSQSFCQKFAERKSPKKYISYFILMSGLGLEPWLFV